jgi:hypothetical protein
MIKSKWELVAILLLGMAFVAVAHYGKDAIAAREQCELHPNACSDDE